MILADLVARLTADTKGFQDGIGGAENKTHSVASGIMSAAGKIAGAIAGAFVVDKIIDFGKESVAAASDLNETMSKSQVVFGVFAKDVEAMGDRAASSLGMSKNAAVGAAATYGNLFRSMNMSSAASSQMSIGLVTMAADLASFNNMDPSEVLDKLRSGLTGETEPLKSLGINLNQAGIEAYAMKNKLWNGVGTISAAAKAQAVYGLALQQTSLAQGDFGRTADGLANQQRTFDANLENTKATLGTALLPVINMAMSAINGLFGSPELQAGIKIVTDGIGQVIAFIQNVVGYIQEQGITSVGDFFYALANGFMGISGGTGILQDIGSALMVIGDTVNSVVTWIGGVIQTFLANVQSWWAANGDAVINNVNAMWTSVSGMFQSAVTFVSTLINWLVTNIQLFWTNHGTAVMGIINGIWVAIQTIFQTVTGVISQIFQGFTDLLQGNWQGFLDHLKLAWEILWGAIKSFAEGAWAGLSTWFQGVVKSIGEFFSKTDWGAIGKGILDGIWNGLKSGWDWLKQQVSNIASSLFEAAKHALGIQSPSRLFAGIGRNMMLGWAGGINETAGLPIQATANVASGTAQAAQQVNNNQSYNFYYTGNSTEQQVYQSYEMARLAI